MAITGPMKAIWSERRSAMYPMSVGRRDIAKNVDDENIYRDGGGTDVSADGIQQGRIERSGVQQQEKRRDARWPAALLVLW